MSELWLWRCVSCFLLISLIENSSNWVILQLSGFSLVWRVWRTGDGLRWTLCHPPYSHCQCRRRSLAGKSLQMKHFHHLSVIGYIFMNPGFYLLRGHPFMMSQKNQVFGWTLCHSPYSHCQCRRRSLAGKSQHYRWNIFIIYLLLVIYSWIQFFLC